MISDPYNILFTSTQIEAWQLSMGHRINAFHKNDPLPSTAVCVLTGGYHVFSGITKYMAFDLNLDFCKVESYSGTEKIQKPTLQRFKDIEGYDLPIKPNQRIYVFDDVIDTGEAAKMVAEYYEANFQPAELILCTVVNKSKEAVKELEKYYSHIWYGFEVEDEWLIGYGMDNPQGFMRQSPSILKMKKYD
jgi:hypoxanthine phosphoribosyltransferase